MKKILMFLSNPFSVDPRVYKEAKALLDEGNEVTVIVWDRQRDYAPESMIDGVRVIRVHNDGVMKILPNDVFRNPLWWRKAYKKALELYRKEYNFDVVHCHDLDTLQIGVWLKKKLDVKLVYDAHEIFGYMIKDTASRWVSKTSLKMEKKLLGYIDHLITIDIPFKDYFASIVDKPITIVMNCKDLEYKKYEPATSDIFTLVYIGLMVKDRFFPDIIDLVGNMEGVKLVIAGKKEGVFEEVKNHSEKYDNVEFLGTIPSGDILPLTRSGDATFILVNPDTGQHKMNLYNKQFEAMVCGRPIIVTKGTYAGKMTEELKCGLTVEYNKESVRDAIIKLRDNPELCEELGRNAFRAAKERYNWEVEKKNLLKVYEEIY